MFKCLEIKQQLLKPFCCTLTPTGKHVSINAHKWHKPIVLT